MKDPREWAVSDLLQLPVGEFDWLEVKGRKGLDFSLEGVKERDVKDNLSKAVSALANSGGGILVIGMEDPSGAWVVDDGGVDLSAKKPNLREWLEDVVPNLVDYRLEDFNVYVIKKEAENSGIQEGRGIIVIQVGDSNGAPHQALDKRYYARVGGKSSPIGHRLVADIMGRRKYPEIKVDFEIIIEMKERNEPAIGVGNFTPIYETTRKIVRPVNAKLIVSACNRGRVYAKHVVCRLKVPKVILSGEESIGYEVTGVFEDGQEYVEPFVTNTVTDFVGINQFSPRRYDPILPGLCHTWDFRLTPDFPTGKYEDLWIEWSTHADNSPIETGKIQIRDITDVHEKRV